MATTAQRAKDKIDRTANKAAKLGRKGVDKTKAAVRSAGKKMASAGKKIQKKAR
jgi:hypothetical protein